jgi:phospholipase C
MQKLVLSRRQALAGLSALGACRPSPSGKESSTPVTPGSIDTVVVVMMENRSFDHVFGSYSLKEGRAEVDGMTADMQNLAQDGSPVAVAEAMIDCVQDPPHGWNSSHDQFNGGSNDGFVREYQDSHPTASPGEVMTYQTRLTMPISYALADAYAVPNRWFCSVMGPTWPNRFYGHAGSSSALKGNSLPSEGGLYTFPTVWSKLDEIGVPWAYYYTDLPFLALFENHIRPETAALLEDFFADAEHGRLPPVVWIDPGFSFNDDHPPHPVGRGQEFLASVYRALANSPHWETCLLIITYDEHGGFFDHVPPPTTDDDHVEDGFDQLGFRIPVVVAGPYVKPGTSDVVFDNTSWIKYICDTYGIEPWTRRIAAANSVAVLLDTDRMARGEPMAPIELPDFVHDSEGEGEECEGQGVLGPPGLPEHEEELGAAIRELAPSLDRRNQANRLLALIREKARKPR